jgi:hypothetical protein
VGWVNDWLYSQYNSAQATNSPPFHDITDNGTTNGFPAGTFGYPAVTGGYDQPTGLGTPNTNNLLNVLVNEPVTSFTCLQ